MRFAKYSGAGNDFVITEAGWSDERAAAVARQVCPRRTSIGADGLILVRSLGSDRASVRFFNPDGSAFSTCGNGTRCAARFALDHGLVEGSLLTLETPAGDVAASVGGHEVELTYRIATSVAGEHSVDGPAGRAVGWLIDIGVPHFVLPVPILPAGRIEEVCRPIRSDPRLGPEGANVDLVEVHDRRHGSIRTFERGVEGETLACGSGAMAATFALHAAGLCEPQLSLRVRGGETLRIGVPREPRAGSGAPEIRLAGTAVHVFDGTYPEARLPA